MKEKVMDAKLKIIRIRDVFSFKKPAFWVIAVSAVAVIALVIGLTANPKDSSKTGFGSSARDLANQYTLALAASDITGMRRFTPALNPPAQEVLDVWRQIQIENAAILQEDIRESKAVFEISVTVKGAPEGYEMIAPGTATYYLYTEKCQSGWYAESFGADGRSRSDLEKWWNAPNLITDGSAGAQRDLRPMLMVNGELYLDTNTIVSEAVNDSDVLGEVLTSIGGMKKPTENGQANFSAVGSKYAAYGEDIAVQINQKWYLFEKEAGSANTAFSSVTIMEHENNEDKAEAELTNKAEIAWLHALLLAGNPTAKASVQDVPNEKSYIRISFLPANGLSDFYVYEKSGNYYVEQPYNGIFEIRYETLEEILTLFSSQTSEWIPLQKLPQEYPPSAAGENGDYVNAFGSISNAETMERFIKAVSKNENAFIRTTFYTKEGDPVITDFRFNGSSFSVTRDTTRDEFGEQKVSENRYANLVEFTSDTIPKERYYFITNLSAITQNDFEEGFDGVVLMSQPI